MRNHVLQNYLDQFLKYLTDNFDNLKFQEASKVAIFIPPNSYILHCHDKSGLFTLYLKGHGIKKFMSDSNSNNNNSYGFKNSLVDMRGFV